MNQGPAYLVLDSGECFPGLWHGGQERAGEVVFNTSHSGYEEMATDPSYFQQILVATAPMQGNYGADPSVWESRQLWISGFVCLILQESERECAWQERLNKFGVATMSQLDTRALTLLLREKGTCWGAMVSCEDPKEALSRGHKLIEQAQQGAKDWVYAVSRSEVEDIEGDLPQGPRVAVLDFGCKENSLRELKARCSALRVFPCRTPAESILAWNPDGVFLSNGPGDPEKVESVAETVAELLGRKFIFGICMGHQILARALGGKTYKLKFGHRGSNHPIKDLLLNQVYVTSQNHGYAVVEDSLPDSVQVTHRNLNDDSVAGIYSQHMNCLGVQFHPESHPGPRDADVLFDFFVKQLK